MMKPQKDALSHGTNTPTPVPVNTPTPVPANARHWSLELYLDMHTRLLDALTASEEELLGCEYLCGKLLREIAQDVFILCVVIRACARLTDHYALNKKQTAQLLALVIADNSYLPFGYNELQKECLYLLAGVEQEVLMGVDPLDVVCKFTRDPGLEQC
jgi:hypothetical protein